MEKFSRKRRIGKRPEQLLLDGSPIADCTEDVLFNYIMEYTSLIQKLEQVQELLSARSFKLDDLIELRTKELNAIAEVFDQLSTDKGK